MTDIEITEQELLELEKELDKSGQPDGTVNDTVFEAFLRNLKLWKPLPPEDQVNLIRNYRQKGDKASKDKLVKHSQRLVFFIVKRCVKSQEDIMDLVQEGKYRIVKSNRRI